MSLTCVSRCCSCPSLCLTFRRGAWLSTHRSWFMCFYLHKYLSHVLNPKFLKTTWLFDHLRLNSYIKCLEMEKSFLLMTQLSSLWCDKRQYITENAHGHDHDAEVVCSRLLAVCFSNQCKQFTEGLSDSSLLINVICSSCTSCAVTHFSLQIYTIRTDSSKFLV